MADISINWSDLAKVAGVSLAFSVGIVVVFALGILGVSRVEAARSEGGNGTAGGALALAGVCFLACAAAALYGIYLIVPQFH